jgi:hypothetical protein
VVPAQAPTAVAAGNKNGTTTSTSAAGKAPAATTGAEKPATYTGSATRVAGGAFAAAAALFAYLL